MKNDYFEEGRIILKYLIGGDPSEILINRYCDAIKTKFKKPKVIIFNKVFQKFPRLLCLIEPVSQPKSEILQSFKQRLDAALVILDTSSEGTRLFYNIDGENRFRLFFILVYKILIEIVIFPIRVLLVENLIKYE